MNTSVRNLTVGGRSIPLDPPRPPEKPHMLLWIDTETTGISRTDATTGSWTPSWKPNPTNTDTRTWPAT